MTFSNQNMNKQELRETVKVIYGKTNIVHEENSKCFYSLETVPVFGEVPLLYTEFYGKDKKKERTRLIYVSVN